MNNIKRKPHLEAETLLRAELMHKYPGTHFDVLGDSMYAFPDDYLFPGNILWLDVRWRGGPSANEVETVALKYEEGYPLDDDENFPQVRHVWLERRDR